MFQTFYLGMRESNPRQRFWRPLSYHLTNPLYICGIICRTRYLYHIYYIIVKCQIALALDFFILTSYFAN